MIVNKKENHQEVDFVIPVDRRVKLKNGETEINTWTLLETVIPIVAGARGTILKGLVKGLKDLETRRQEETILTIVLLRSARILRRVLETRGDVLYLKLQ